MTDTEFVGDPVAAYDRIAPFYWRLAEQRRAYLAGVDELIVQSISPGSRSMLDVGSGDGARARRIARAAGVTALTLLEPSEGMRGANIRDGNMWAIRAESLHLKQGCFDIVTCLWNVLGHILPATARAEALRQFARLTSPRGAIFIDVSHRYNAAHYGILPTARRALRDMLAPNEKNGDVRVSWDVDGTGCAAHCVATSGHVFTHGEFRLLCQTAGLRIAKRFVVSYASGEPRRLAVQGNLLYVLRRKAQDGGGA